MKSDCTDSSPLRASALSDELRRRLPAPGEEASSEQWAAFRAWRLADFPPPPIPVPPFKVSDPQFIASAFVQSGAPSSLEAWVVRVIDARIAGAVEDIKAMIEKAAEVQQAEMEATVARLMIEVVALMKKQEGPRR